MAIAGLVVNGAAALLVIAVARLVTPQAYGAIAQLLGLFFILSMPGSAVLVGVVRRVTALQNAGRGHLVRAWVGKVHRIVLAALAVEVVVVVLLQGWIARQLSLPNSQGIVFILVAAGVWILLCVDRGLLQAHRSYRGLAGNLLIEGGVRTVCVLVLVVAHLGVAGYALGVFLGEVVATVHAHWLASKTWALEPGPACRRPRARRLRPDTSLVRRKLMADVSAAFVGLALLGLLQNVDVILLGPAGPRQRRAVRGHLGGVQGAGLRGPGPRAPTCCPRPPSGGTRAATPSASWGSPSSSWPCRPRCCWSSRCSSPGGS